MLYINDDIYGFDLDEALDSVSEQRRGQALRLGKELDRRLCVAAYRLLCVGLRQEYGITTLPVLERHEGGKPYLAGFPGIHFSMSHCAAAAVCAISTEPVGADVETIRAYSPRLARRVLSRAELERVERAYRPDVEFIRLWTMKESRLKLTGEGIRRDLRRVLDGGDARYATGVCLQRGYIYTVCTGR